MLLLIISNSKESLALLSVVLLEKSQSRMIFPPTKPAYKVVPSGDLF